MNNSTKDDDDDEGYQYRDSIITARSILVAFLFMFLAIRVGHIIMARSFFQKNNFPSTSQYKAVLSLNMLSILVGMFTIAEVNITLWCWVTKDCMTSYHRFFYVCYSMQNFCYNLWLISRDRALQSNYFSTNIITIYVVLFLSVISAALNLSFLPGREARGDMQILGQLLQIVIVVIMTVVFVLPLLRTAHSQSVQSDVLRDVILRTAIGAFIHVTLTICFMLLLFDGEYFIDAIGFVAWDVAVYATAGFPALLHIAISHRDDKPLIFTISGLFGLCSSEGGGMQIKFNLGTYRKAAIETFEEENNEVKRMIALDMQARESYASSITDKQDSIDLGSVYSQGDSNI